MLSQLALCFFLWAVSPGLPQAAHPNSAPPGGIAAETAAQHTLPQGTTLYLRLKTEVSTTTSHLNERIEAVVERALLAPDDAVEVPLGAIVSGRIVRLIPSSSPTDRARLVLRFDSLTLPGHPPVQISAHLNGIDNARERVTADGTVVGLLQSELPVTLLNSAMAKMGKRNSGTAKPQQADTGNSQNPWFGKPDTSITYPAGTEFSVELDKPAEASGKYEPEFAHQIPAALSEAVGRLMAKSPRRVASKKGNKGGVVNLVLVGSQDQVQKAFAEAGWTESAKENSSSLWKTFEAVIGGKGYDAAPMSTLYLYGRPQDMDFEKMLNTFAMRHHLRIWKAPVNSPDGRPLWLVAADHDNGVDIHPGVISHATDPHVDAERAKVGADLGMTGMVSAEALITPPDPLHSGTTATGGDWETDGQILVVEMKPSS